MRFKPGTGEVGHVRIGELASATGVSVRSLRYYEEQELITSTRTSGGQRRYTPDAVDRVLLVQHLFAGLTSRDALQLLPCVYSGTTTPAMLERLHHERARVAAQADELAATRDRLDAVIVEATARLAVPAAAAS